MYEAKHKRVALQGLLITTNEACTATPQVQAITITKSVLFFLRIAIEDINMGG
jgi:hypothetical protein